MSEPTHRDEVWPLDALVPYWRNPRRITDEATNAVATSIKKYGYQQPIVIDDQGVIIVGHTRYAAIRRLGYTEATVRVVDGLTPQEIKQLRLIDNRTGEMSSWDVDALVEEMRGLDEDLMSRFFPEVASQVFDDIAQHTEEQVWDVGGDNDWDPEAEVDRTTDFVCPRCFHEWRQDVTREDVMAGRVEGPIHEQEEQA